MSMHNVPSWATIPRFDEPLFAEEFQLLVLLVAIQQHPTLEPVNALRHLLSYYRAWWWNGSTADLAEIFEFGRVGYADCNESDLEYAVMEHIGQADVDGAVSAWDANNFIDWAFGVYLTWE